MATDKKAPVRPYHVQQQVGKEIKESLVIATNEAQARAHATKSTVSARVCKTMDVVELQARGLVPEYARENAGIQTELAVGESPQPVGE